MSFGYSVGDFLALLKLANDLRKQFQDAPAQYKDVSNESVSIMSVKKLSNVLRVIEDCQSDHNLSDQQKEFLETLPKSCQDVLEKLRETLDKYSLVVSDGRNAKSSIQRVWNRITWDPKEARYFHEKIVSEIAYFNLFLAQSALQVVRETRSMVALSMDKVNKLVEADDDNKRLSMLDWLSSRNPEAKHAGILNRRQAETGQWFLETEKFQQWLAHDCHVSKDQSTLFCHGYEGAGKTFISAIVVEHLRQRLGSDDAVRIAFFYCDFSEQPTVSNILASLLRQLLQGNTSQLSSLKALYDALEKKQRHPTEDEILGLLDTAISCHSKVFIVIDALDECRLPSDFKESLRKVFSLQEKHGLCLFVTCRKIPIIAELFNSSPSVEIYAHEEDIRRYLESGLRGVRLIKAKPEIKTEIISTIIEAAEGMFLLATLQLESLKETKCQTAKTIRDSLKALPTTLDDAYKKGMRRIESQANIDTEIAKLVLAWIICATRPLSPLELQHALAVEFGESTFDEWSLFEIEYIVSVCAGMVTVDEERNVIRLQHYTMQEFFLKTWTEYFPDAHGTLASTCISYLRHEAFRVELAASPNQYDESLKRFSLYEYSAKHWGYHARQSYSKVKELVQDFVQNEHALAHSLQVLFNRYVWRNKQGYSMTVSPLHPAAYFGLDECVLHFLVTGVPCDTKDEDNQTALHWAARNGQVETAELLLRQGLDINCADKEGKTALHYAAIQDNSSLIKLLVEYKADIEYTDIEGQTPLLAAVQSMKLGSVQKLIGLGASIKAVDSMRHSALHLSTTAGSRSIQITKFLLASGAFSEICDVENMIPMHYAIREGSEETVEALIQAGACVNAGIQRKHWIGMKEAGRLVYKVSPEIQKATETNHDGLTPLHWAALIGYPAMIKYLISKGADPNKRCQDGDTPLHLAIREDITPDYGDAWNSPSWRIEVLCELVEAGSEEADDAHRSVSKIRSAVIEILLSHPRLDVDLQNEQLQTPLHLVACSMDDSMVSFSRLMSKKPDISIRNYKGQTPLHLASGAGKAGMVEDLLAARASVDVLDSEGLSPLQYSVRSGKSSAAVVKLLLKCYGMIQLNPCTRKDGAGRNLLHQYLQTDAPSKEVILTMLDHGANVNEIDTEGNSPLSLCLRTSNLILNRASTCRVLLENGASVLWSDESGRNLAHISMLAYPWKPVDEVLSTLNELGVDIAAKDSNNRGILHHGAMNGSISQGIIDLLRESGSLSLQDQDNDGRTPLSYAEAMLHKDRGFSRSRRKLTLDVLVKANGD